MFEETKNPVTEDVAENVEVTTEQTTVDNTTEPVESEEDRINRLVNEKVDELLPKKLARKEAKIRKEYDSKYGRVENVLKSGLGVDSLEEATNQLSEFYTRKGIEIPTTPLYSERDMEVLAKAEADDIISYGFDEVIEEVDRLADLGVANMTPREKLVFTRLAEYRQNEESKKELASIGVKADVIDSNEFKEFASQFNANTPVTKVYELYKKTLPKEDLEPIGSMKNTTTNEAKDYYTPDEVRRLTSTQLDNPEIMKAVEKSMQIWYEKGIK